MVDPAVKAEVIDEPAHESEVVKAEEQTPEPEEKSVVTDEASILTDEKKD